MVPASMSDTLSTNSTHRPRVAMQDHDAHAWAISPVLTELMDQHAWPAVAGVPPPCGTTSCALSPGPSLSPRHCPMGMVPDKSAVAHLMVSR